MEDIQKVIPRDVDSCLIFFVNGKKVEENNPDPEWTLLWYLRNKLQLTGTKYGCGEGGCGACTVMLSQYLEKEDRVKHIAVNACLTPICSVHGLAVTTVEGIGSTQEKLHAVQERIAKAHGSQCGFCTPGFVMSMYCLLRTKISLSYHDIETALQGNLCRCTGYRPIIEGFQTFIEGWEAQYCKNKKDNCALGENCCKNKTEINKPHLFEKSSFEPYDKSQEPIFPPELKVNFQKYSQQYLMFKNQNVIWLRPNSLKDLLIIKEHFPHAKIVVGNTEIGVEVKIKKMVYPLLISPSIISDINYCKVSDSGIVIGSTVSLTDTQAFLKDFITMNSVKGKICQAIIDTLHWFAGTQVRNVGCMVGNLVTASPISDLNPILMAASATVNVCNSTRGHSEIKVDENFFTGYRKTKIKQDEIVISIQIPFTSENQYFRSYKQARRRDDDISIVTAAFSITFYDKTDIISNAKICYGGMGPITMSAVRTSEKMIGKKWDYNLINIVLDSLNEEFYLTTSVPGGMAEYRKILCLSLFFKFSMYVNNKLRKPQNGFRDYDMESSHKIEPSSSQYFSVNNDGRKLTDAVGLPVIHASAFKQATGEAIYCDDIPHIQGELYLTLITSAKPYARIKEIDATKALAVPGVEAFFSAADLSQDCNKLGPIIKDEEIFATEIVTSRACVIGAIVAQNEAIARVAKSKIRIEYEDLEPVIITIEEAIINSSYFDGYPRTLRKGNVEKATIESTHLLEGSVRTGAQEHFYLETVGAFAMRKEEEIEIICSTQHPAEIAQLVSHALMIPSHKVVSKVKRIGGGFGGKETRTAVLALPVAIAAYKLKKPVRAVLDRDEDMQVTGYRHPVLVKYKVAFNDDGVITAAVFDLYCNAGNSMDISCAMIDRAMTHVDNCYFIPNVEVNGYICKTNLPSNTAFRGFGAPQAMLAAETMVRDVAAALGKTYEEIVNVNLYREGQLTHYNQLLSHCTLTRCWEECLEMSKYQIRKMEVEKFNRENMFLKKGIALVPTKYGISFGVDILMQAGALLLVYADGSVLISIGGIEMGQGLFTKMIQVASRALGVDINKIHISEMATDKVPNSSPTAGSISSDLNGMAVVNACNILNERLQPYKLKNPDGKWEDWVAAAYVDRVNLSVSGFYCSPKIQYKIENNSGSLFEYFTYGVACSEVIIDCLTGDHDVLRTDIVMDVGESLNPAIDIGQIEGAFMQGYGLFTIEEVLFSSNGEVLTKGPGTYKIPAISNIPKEFNVSLLRGAPNPRAVYSSKAVGEPPLFLAASVFFAIKEAIKSSRNNFGASTDFKLDAPATCEKIRLACVDDITRKVVPTIGKDGREPWNVVV